MEHYYQLSLLFFFLIFIQAPTNQKISNGVVRSDQNPFSSVQSEAHIQKLRILNLKLYKELSSNPWVFGRYNDIINSSEFLKGERDRYIELLYGKDAVQKQQSTQYKMAIKFLGMNEKVHKNNK